MYLLFGYKNNSHCQTAVTVVQYSLSMAYIVSVTALQCICVPLGISVPGGFFILNCYINVKDLVRIRGLHNKIQSSIMPYRLNLK